ncbi:hypothetical protein BD560DRAFT_324503 [Blakeslea trispora]|nr:hypothetical protein BD560DRAFT_324503 [Blakeslea trispora]
MSSSKSDPRREEAIVPFHLPRRSELEEDWSSVIATFVAMAGIMTRNRYKVIPWVAAYFGLTAFLNTRKSLKSKDSLANNGAMLSFISLVTFYINLYFAHKKGLEAVANGDVKLV